MVNVAPDRILHTAVALAAVPALLLSAAQQTEDVTANLLASLFLTATVVTDTLTLKIPNGLVLAAILLGLAVNGYGNATLVQGVAVSLAGIVVGLVLLFPLYLAGGMGAGDVKALAALGSLTGPSAVLQIFLYTALIGGVISLLHYCVTSDLRKQSRALLNSLRALPYSVDFKALAPEPGQKRPRLPYAAAIALGFFAFHHWGPIIPLPW